MKLTGNEWVSLCAEESNKPIWTISQLTLDKLLNSHILGDIEKQLKDNEKISKFEISYLSIGDTIITKGTRIHAKFQASLKEHSKDSRYPENFECIFTYLDICDFYNSVLDLFFDYAQVFNTDVSNIKLDFIEIEIMIPVTFTNKGFINSELLTQYDLDGQIGILAYLLKTQKWEIRNNTIIFRELLNDRYVKTLIKLFNTECMISTEIQKESAINYCTIFGVDQAKKSTDEKLKNENSYKAELEKVINNNKEFYAHNLTRYETKFDKEGIYDEN